MTPLPTLRQAMVVLSRRKRALFDSDIEKKEGSLSMQVGREGMGALLGGFDLNPDDVMRQAFPVTLLALAASISDDYEPTEIGVGLWVDGLATGLVLGELRQKASMSAPTGDEGVGD